MPIPLRNLDDRTYTDLVAEAQNLLPHLQPEWTNYNPSDPGIMLIELFAWLTEMVLYRLNEVTEKQTEVFLELINGAEWQRQPGEELNTAVREAILKLRERHRAVTSDDFAYLINSSWPQTAVAQSFPGNPIIDRHHCLPERRPAPNQTLQVAPSHISVVVLPAAENDDDTNRTLLDALGQFLGERCLLTVQHHLLLPSAKAVAISADLHLRVDVPPTVGLKGAREALTRFFDWRHGGEAGSGWPFGRHVYASELYAALREVAQIDYVDGMQLSSGEEKSDIEIALEPHQLATVNLDGLTAVDPLGNRHQWLDEPAQ